MTMRNVWVFACIAPLLLALAASAAAPPADEAQDDEDRAYQAGLARRAMQDNCLICHSEEMIASQRLTIAQWKTEVEKMVGWGAPLPPDQQTMLIDYLANQFSDRTPRAEPARMSYQAALAAVQPHVEPAAAPEADPERGAKLYALNCANCHGVDAQGAELGPNLVEKPVLFRRGDYQDVVRKGRRRMPGLQPVVNPTQEDDILAWLRQRRYQVPANKKPLFPIEGRGASGTAYQMAISSTSGRT